MTLSKFHDHCSRDPSLPPASALDGPVLCLYLVRVVCRPKSVLLIEDRVEEPIYVGLP